MQEPNKGRWDRSPPTGKYFELPFMGICHSPDEEMQSIRNAM